MKGVSHKTANKWHEMLYTANVPTRWFSVVSVGDGYGVAIFNRMNEIVARFTSIGQVKRYITLIETRLYTYSDAATIVITDADKRKD